MYFMDGPWGLHGGLATPSRMVLISKTTHQKNSHLSCSEQAPFFLKDSMAVRLSTRARVSFRQGDTTLAGHFAYWRTITPRNLPPGCQTEEVSYLKE